MRLPPILALSILLMGFAATPAAAKDRHAGYYYPEPQTTETYGARAETLADNTRRRRLGFATTLMAELIAKPYPPPFAVFAKGEQAEKLIVVALSDGAYDTIYRARALFATLTATSRLTPLFKDLQVQDRYTFFDLAKLLGFKQITISDGDRFAHQVLLR